MIIVAGTFVLVAALVLGSYWLFVVRPDARESGQLRRRLRHTARTDAAKGRGFLKPPERLSAVGAIDRLLGQGRSAVAPLEVLLQQSGMRLTLGALLLGCACLAAAAFFLAVTLTGSLLLGVAAGAVALPLPLAWVRHVRNRRVAKFEEFFPEAIDLIARALRAGHSFTTGLAMVADELPPPVSTEFRLLYDRQNFGEPVPDALRAFAARVPLLDARFFATAVLTQRESGGNLAEVLDNLSAVIRERFKVKRQVRVISAHGRITGWVLIALPPALAMLFLLVSDRHMQTLVHDPLGMRLLIGALVLQGMGSLAIRQIVRIEY